MSQYAEDLARRKRAEVAARNAVVALSTAGMCLLAGRDDYPADAQELATALRDDITNMIGDAEALISVIQGR